MPVNYADDVASASSWNWTLKVLLRWRGSLYQALWLPVLLYISMFLSLSAVYKWALTTGQQDSFISFCRYCDRYSSQMPVALMLGFFTSTVMNRWWSVCTSMPGTDGVISEACHTIVPTKDPTNVSIVQTIARYTILSWILHMRIVCGTIRQKYPTLQSMESSGLLLPHETPQLEDSDVQYQNTKPWLPIVWCTLLLRKAALEDRITSSQDAVNLLNTLEGFRNNCSTILKYYFTNIPLVATQAVTLVVHTFGFATLFGKQFFDVSVPTPLLVMELYVPILPVMQYIGYLGWLKLAEILINPFGDDEDDFDLNKALEKNLKSSAFIIKLYNEKEDYTPEETEEAEVAAVAEDEDAEDGREETEGTRFRV